MLKEPPPKLIVAPPEEIVPPCGIVMVEGSTTFPPLKLSTFPEFPKLLTELMLNCPPFTFIAPVKVLLPNNERFPGPVIPVVYNVNLRDPSGYFLATKFQMRNKDVMFASNALAVEQAKIMNYIRLVTATINDPIVAATNGYALRAAVRGGTPSVIQ